MHWNSVINSCSLHFYSLNQSLYFQPLFHIYIYFFVKSKSKKIRPFRHTLSQNENRLTAKVIVIFISLVIFTVPQFIGIIFTFYFDVKSPTIKRNIIYWKALIL